MAQQGSVTVNFGAGALEATAAVVGQTGLTGANLVEAWPLVNETVGSTNDDSGWVEQMQAYVTQIVGGTGFTIVVKPLLGKAFGSYNIGWVWN
jgi:hypothetical protein